MLFLSAMRYQRHSRVTTDRAKHLAIEWFHWLDVHCRGEIESTGRQAFKSCGTDVILSAVTQLPPPLVGSGHQKSTQFADLCTMSRGRVDVLLHLEEAACRLAALSFGKRLVLRNRDCSRRLNIVASKFFLSLLASRQAVGWCNCVLNMFANILYHVTMLSSYPDLPSLRTPNIFV